jgi:signal transduction histidine kinase
MSGARIRFSPDILRRLGEELNPSPDRGIIELVKNAYDADAKHCTIEIRNVERPGGSIKVIDDGRGMDDKGIQRGWLILGRSQKCPTKRSPLGRIPAGSKGLGRLAALRLGTRATLITRPIQNESSEYALTIDWKEFDGVEVVEDVVLTIDNSTHSAESTHGSEILLEDLRSRITRIDVKRLARDLILLSDPFGEDPGSFRPTLSAPEFADLEQLVQRGYFDQADFHLIARLDAKGRAKASVVDWRGNELFSAGHEDIAHKRPSYESPPAEFDLWVFLLQKATFSDRSASVGEVRAWLQEFGGVHLYQNGLRVSPYGNPGNDWLDMNLRRSQSPEERPSTNTSIGRVTIFDKKNLLIQKTDRSGFIEGPVFQEIRSFAQDAMEWMASRRLEKAEKRRTKDRVAASATVIRAREKLQETIESAPAGAQQKLNKALTAYDHSREREAGRLRKEVQLYRTLSTAGITAATFAHESSGNPIKTITQSIKAIERRAKSALKEYDRLLREPVESIVHSVESLAVLGTATLRLLDHEKRRVGRVDIHDVIKDVLVIFKPFLDGCDVKVTVDLDKKSPFLRGTEAAIESIITNLLNNAVAAFEDAGSDARKIVVRTRVEDDALDLRVLDSGPGIEGINKRDMWLPGQTTRRNGTGLGLTIVRDAVVDFGGTVDAFEHGALGGAEIILRMPILGS